MKREVFVHFDLKQPSHLDRVRALLRVYSKGDGKLAGRKLHGLYALHFVSLISFLGSHPAREPRVVIDACTIPPQIVRLV